MAQSKDLELEVEPRTEHRTHGDGKSEQGSGIERRKFGNKYNSCRLRSLRVFERHRIVLVCGLTGDVGGNTCKQTVQYFPIKKPAGGNYRCNAFGVGDVF